MAGCLVKPHLKATKSLHDCGCVKVIRDLRSQQGSVSVCGTRISLLLQQYAASKLKKELQPRAAFEAAVVRAKNRGREPRRACGLLRTIHIERRPGSAGGSSSRSCSPRPSLLSADAGSMWYVRMRSGAKCHCLCGRSVVMHMH